jgi:hypothetical protein
MKSDGIRSSLTITSSTIDECLRTGRTYIPVCTFAVYVVVVLNLQANIKTNTNESELWE